MRERHTARRAPGKRTSLLLVMLLGLSAGACAFDIEEARNLAAEGEGFNQALAREYRDIALFEADDMYDWPDAALFSRKAVLAASGQVPAPELLDDWNVPQSAIAELSQARTTLANSLGAGFGGDAPALAASAQASFDCWIEQQEEGWQIAHIDRCKRKFLAAMENWATRTAAAQDSAGDIAGKADEVPPSDARPPVFVAQIATEIATEIAAESGGHEGAEPQCPPEDRAAPAPAEEFLIRFRHDSAQLDPAADDALIEIAFHARGAEVAKIFIAGHADLSGTDDYNLDLSLNRALAVWRRMISLGTPVEKLWLGPRGEIEPLSNAADGVADSQDRRVLVSFVEISDSELVGTDACDNPQTVLSDAAGLTGSLEGPAP
jgi:OOP family OmpA-OmpF porin